MTLSGRFELAIRESPGLRAALATAIPLVVLLLALGPIAASAAPHFGAKTDYSIGAGAQSVAIGDLNRDGKLDLAVPYANGVAVLFGNGNGTLGTRTDLTAGANPYSVAIGDPNGDGEADLAVACSGSNAVSVIPGNGDGTFGAKTDWGTGSGPVCVAIEDLNGDGRLDLATANSGANTVSVLLGNGNGTFGAKTDYATGTYPQSVAIADLNRDGRPDLVVADRHGTESVFLGNGDGTFGTKTSYSGGGGQGVGSLAIADLNRDGKLDLAVASPGAAVSVLLGNGDGTFGAKTDYRAGNYNQSVAIGDLDLDGKPDLVTAVGYNSYAVSVLPGNGDGTFGTATDFEAGRWPTFVAIGDLNGDGAPDLAVVNQYVGTLSVLLNTNVPVAIEVSLAAVSAEPDRVRLDWYASTSDASATVYRRTETTAWGVLGQVRADGAGHLRFEDRAVEAGQRYGYRLGIYDGGSEHFAAETWVEVPVWVGLALEGLRPNPAAAALVVALSLPSAAPARLELLDVSGRRLLERDLRGLGPGQVMVRLGSSADVKPGLYFLRLSQGGRAIVSRGCVVR